MRRRFFKNNKSIHKFFFGIIVTISIWACIKPNDSYMWLTNMAVAIVYTAGFTLTYKKFQFSTFAYILICIHISVILVAAKYTYEFNPLFEWIKNVFGLQRNYYDRVGHFMQGFVPVILARELFLRRGYMKKSKFFIITLLFFMLGISGAWELLEFVGSEAFGKTEVYTVSMQGDAWDAQWDMTMCTIGAITSLLLFSRYHDKKIEEINEVKE